MFRFFRFKIGGMDLRKREDLNEFMKFLKETTQSKTIVWEELENQSLIPNPVVCIECKIEKVQCHIELSLPVNGLYCLNYKRNMSMFQFVLVKRYRWLVRWETVAKISIYDDSPVFGEASQLWMEIWASIKNRHRRLHDSLTT